MAEPDGYTNGTLRYRVAELEKDAERMNRRIDALGDKLDRIFWAVLGLAFTIAGGVTVFALTVLAVKGGP